MRLSAGVASGRPGDRPETLYQRLATVLEQARARSDVQVATDEAEAQPLEAARHLEPIPDEPPEMLVGS